MTAALKDPRTYRTQSNREGLPGHRGYHRSAPVTSRLLPELREALKTRRRQLGFATDNDYINNLLANDLYGMGAQSGATQHALSSPALVSGSSPAHPHATLPTSDLYTRFLAAIEEAQGPETYQTWFGGVGLVAETADRLTIELHATCAWHARETWIPWLTATLSKIAGRPMALSIEGYYQADREAPPAPPPPPEPPKEPTTIEELEEIFVVENIEVCQARANELDAISTESNSFALVAAKSTIAKARWAEEDKKRALEQRKRKDALVAKLYPILTAAPRPVDHAEEWRKGAGKPGSSAFETTTKSTKASSLRELRGTEKRRPTPDTT